MSAAQTGREEFIQYLDLRRLNGLHSRSFTYTFQDKFDSQGDRQCVWCGTKIPKGKRRQRWCSDSCVDQFRTVKGDMTYIRDLVLKRDHGVCGQCGLDAEALKKVLAQDLAFFGRIGVSFNFPQINEFYKRWYCWLSKKQKEKWVEIFATLPGCPVSVQQYCSMAHQGAMWLRDWLARRSFWQADHHIEVVDGGFGCDLNNIITLCKLCHDRKTHNSAKTRKGKIDAG